MKYPAYPDYKDSPIPWLPKVPATWEVHRLKWAVTSCDNGVWGEEPDGGPDDVACIRVADFDRVGFSVSANNLTMRSIDARQRASRQVRKGDLLIEKSGGGEKQLVGCVVQFGHDFPAVCSNFVARMGVAEGQNSRYWTYAHAALYAGRLNDPAIKQTTGIQNLDAGEYLNNLFAYAPAEEQKKIADFLDWRTAQIDALIAKKHALLDRMREEQDAVVTAAVTRGLDPSQPKKPSGVPWLGEVPRHWELKRLKWAVTFQRGHDLPADDRNEGDIPLVSSSGISAVHDTAIAKAPGIVTGRYGTIGVFHLIQQDYWPLNTTLYSIDLHGNNPLFLCSLLENLAPLFLLNAKKSAVPGVDRNDLHQIEVALPPRQEQDRIAEHLTKYQQKVEAVRARVSEAIERLTEYRSALITAAVTGQIDVRGVKVPATV